MHRSKTFRQIKILICLATAISLALPPPAFSQSYPDDDQRHHLRATQIHDFDDPANKNLTGLEETLRRAGQEPVATLETPGLVAVPVKTAGHAKAARTFWQFRDREVPAIGSVARPHLLAGLEELTGEAKTLAEKVLGTAHPEVKFDALSKLGRMAMGFSPGEQQLGPYLDVFKQVLILRQGNNPRFYEPMRAKAADTLGLIGDFRAMDAFEIALGVSEPARQDPSKDVRVEVIKSASLLQAEDSAGLDRIIALLEHGAFPSGNWQGDEIAAESIVDEVRSVFNLAKTIWDQTASYDDRTKALVQFRRTMANPPKHRFDQVLDLLGANLPETPQEVSIETWSRFGWILRKALAQERTLSANMYETLAFWNLKSRG